MHGIFKRPSFLMRVATWVLRRRGKPLAAENFATFRRTLLERAYPDAAPIPASLHRLCVVREESICGQAVFTLTPRREASSARVIYLHGGAYVNPLRDAHWSIIQSLVERAGATVTVPLYPLAPENDHRAAFVELTEVYRRILEERPGVRVVLAGDSAGGGLALAFAMRCREEELPMPARVILFSPWLDITMSNPAARDIEPLDVMLGVDSLRFCGELWAGDAHPRSAHLSPLLGELGGLPSIDIYQGTHDIFLADTRLLREKVTEAAGQARLFEYPGAFHVFVAAPFLPEAKDAWGKVAESLKDI